MLRKENIMVLRKEPGIFVRTGFTDMRKQINGLSAGVYTPAPQRFPHLPFYPVQFPDDLYRFLPWPPVPFPIGSFPVYPFVWI
jgi:hypothetical protein